VNADHGKDVRIFFGKLDRAPAAFHGSADSDDASDSGFVGATKNIVEIRGEIGIIEVRVGFD
jgi:hypothetical protein